MKAHHRTIFRTTASTPVRILWECSRCGQENEQTLLLSETGEVSLPATYLSKETKQAQQAKASARAREALQAQTDKLLSGRARGRFRKAELDQCCSRCGHREPWARLRFARAGIAVGALFVAGLAAALFLLYEEKYAAAAWVAGSICAAVLLWSLYKGIRTLVQERRIARLPQQSLPVYRFEPDSAVTEKHTVIRRI